MQSLMLLFVTVHPTPVQAGIAEPVGQTMSPPGVPTATTPPGQYSPAGQTPHPPTQLGFEWST